MEISEGKFGKILFCDCLDQQFGLPSLQDKSFDLGWTDPLWQQGFNYVRSHGRPNVKQHFHKELVNYEDDKFDPEFNMKFYNELRRTCNAVVIEMGWINFNWWVKNTDPYAIFIVVFDNSANETKISKFNGTKPLLCYGEQNWWKKHKFHRNYYKTHLKLGICRDDHKYLHPSPKSATDYYDLIKELNPESVLDCFIGSGTTGEVCESLKIKRWLGYEIKPEYKQDIDFRLKRGMQLGKAMRKKRSLMTYEGNKD